MNHHLTNALLQLKTHFRTQDNTLKLALCRWCLASLRCPPPTVLVAACPEVIIEQLIFQQQRAVKMVGWWRGVNRMLADMPQGARNISPQVLT